MRCDLLYIRDIINKENAEKDLMLETTSELQMNPQHQQASSNKVLSSRVIGSSQPTLRNLAGSVHELNQTGSGATGSHKVLTSDRKNKGSQELQSLEQKLSPLPSANLTQVPTFEGSQELHTKYLRFFHLFFGWGGTPFSKLGISSRRIN